MVLPLCWYCFDCFKHSRVFTGYMGCTFNFNRLDGHQALHEKHTRSRLYKGRLCKFLQSDTIGKSNLIWLWLICMPSNTGILNSYHKLYNMVDIIECERKLSLRITHKPDNLLKSADDTCYYIWVVSSVILYLMKMKVLLGYNSWWLNQLVLHCKPGIAFLCQSSQVSRFTHYIVFYATYSQSQSSSIES